MGIITKHQAAVRSKITHKNNKPSMRFYLGFSVLAICFLAVYFDFDWQASAVSYYYIAMSLMTFFIYGFDKVKAKRGYWRISERSLHILSLLGGWPGAAMAQAVLRHKSAKTAFLRLFWITVVANVALITWLRIAYTHYYPN